MEPAPHRPANARIDIELVFLLLLLSAMPDTMVIPLVKELVVDRYEVTDASAHLFLILNLVGALLALPFIAILKPLLGLRKLLFASSLAGAILLCVMSMPIGFVFTIGLRLVEGMTDVLIFAVLMDMISRIGPKEVPGFRFGIAATVLMGGLALGMLIGGSLADQLGENVALIFLVGGGIYLLIALLAATLKPFNTQVDPVVDESTTVHTAPGRLFFLVGPLLMNFSDRAISGLITASLPLYLSRSGDYSAVWRGGFIASILLAMAVANIPAGWLSDRFGALPVRIISGTGYALAIASIPLLVDHPIPLLALMVLIGILGSGLMPSALSLLCLSGQGAVGMGGFRGAGEFGFLSGMVLSGILLGSLKSLGFDDDSGGAYSVIILAFAALHLCITAASALVILMGMKRR